MKIFQRVIVLLTATTLAAACDSGTSPREFLVRLQIAADSVDCNGAFGPRRCLSVRELVGGDAWGSWQPFFESIEGFSHEPGFVYDVLVARRDVPNPPADGSSVAFRLVRVIDKRQEP